MMVAMSSHTHNLKHGACHAPQLTSKGFDLYQVPVVTSKPEVSKDEDRYASHLRMCG